MRFAFDDDSRDPARDPQEDELDREFPLGDGTADTSGVVVCPYCGEESGVTLDPGSGEAQDYVEDCPVCCNPWRVSVHYLEDGTAVVTATALDD